MSNQIDREQVVRNLGQRIAQLSIEGAMQATFINTLQDALQETRVEVEALRQENERLTQAKPPDKAPDDT